MYNVLSHNYLHIPLVLSGNSQLENNLYFFFLNSTTVVNFFISYNPYIFNHKYMNDTNSYMFDIQSIFFLYRNSTTYSNLFSTP